MKVIAIILSVFIFGLTLSSCATNKTGAESGAQAQAAQPKVHVTCINQYFSNDAESLAKEKKFVIIPYKELSPPKDEKKKSEPEGLYFDRVAKMTEKILVDAGLKPTKSIDNNTLVIGLTWSTKNKPVGWHTSSTVAKASETSESIYKVDPLGYTNYLSLKAMDFEKKETRWQIKADGESTDTFYLDVLPLLLSASSKYVGKNCDKPIYETVDNSSPEVAAIRDYKGK